VPRLTNKDYLSQRDFLVDAWGHFQRVFTVLPYEEQMVLHAFYLPYKDITREEAVEHRQLITKKQPSLPHRAGKSYAKLYSYSQALQHHLVTKPARDPNARVKALLTSGRNRNIRVFALANPELDVEKLAKALIEVAKDMADERKSAA